MTAKKWLWQFEYPDGSRTINELHVPVNKPVKFIMTSEDVLHDFFVPDMRVKHDVIPGRYTEIWFTPTVLGVHHITCAEYCGKGHSDMLAKVTVDTDAEFAKWMETGGTRMGRVPRQEYDGVIGASCSGSARAATAATRWTARAARAQLEGHLRQERKPSRTARTVVVDENYLRRVDVESAGQGGARVMSPSCRPSRDCCGSMKSRA